MTAGDFVIRFPEFTTAAPALVTATLAEAQLSVDVAVFGPKADAAQGLLAAHLLWTGVAGNSLRLTADGSPQANPKSPYWARYMRLVRETAVGFLVL